MNVENLIKKFDQANLELVRAKVPLGGTNDAIFQLDIRRKWGCTRKNIFMVWPGAEDNVASVQDYDKKLKQVVLFVKEEEREFWDNVRGFQNWNKGTAKLARTLGINERDLRWNSAGGLWQARQRTHGDKRHMLVGHDERDLFMCQLPQAVTTVRRAHEVLKPRELEVLVRKGGDYERQGEWFFIPISDAELEMIEDDRKLGVLIIHTYIGIGSLFGRGGKPHVAQEIVFYDHGVGRRVYVRGAVTHPDHRARKFRQWHRVLPNTEMNNTRPSFFGGTWVD